MHPKHCFKETWDYLIIGFHTYYVFEVPYAWAFLDDSRIVTFYVIDFFFFVDFLFCLITPYYDDMLKMVVSEKKIIRHYFTRYLYMNFVMDLLNFLPLPAISMRLSILKTIRIFGKFGRIFECLEEIIEHVAQFYVFRSSEAKRISNFMTSIFSLLMAFLTLVHFTSCILISIGYKTEYEGFSWVDAFEGKERRYIYVEGVFIVLITFSAVGYGIFQPISNTIYFYLMVLEVLF